MDRLSHEVEQVRSRISNVLLVVLTITAMPALAASLYRIATIGWLPVMALHIAAFAVLCLATLLRSRLSYQLRAAIIVFLCVLVGLAGLWQAGLQGAYYFAIVAPAVCAIFFGARIGVAVLVASLLVAGAIGMLTVLGHRLPPFDPVSYAVQPSAWAAAFISWAMVGASLLAAVVMYNRGLYAALNEANRHETSLRLSEERFRSIVEHSPNAFSLKDLQGRYLLVNERFEALFGLRRENVIGRTTSEIFEGAFARSGIEHDRQVIAQKQAVEAEESFDKGDLVLTLLTKKFPIFGRSGEVTAVGAVHADLTEYRRAEADATQLGRILDDSPVEIYSMDVDSFRFVRVNRGARENLGYTLDELQQMTPADIAPKFDPARLTERLGLLEQGQQDYFAYETEHRRKDGSTYPVRLRLQLVSYQGTRHLFGIAEDISERIRTEAQLRQAQKMEAVGQLTGGVAHDFNNLLSVILGNLELVKENAALHDDSRAQIEMAINAAERGAQLTLRLLAFSRKQALRPVPVDVGRLIEDTLVLLRRSLGETVEIEIRTEPGLWNTEVDPGQLESALMNLAINARDAMPDGGKLTIEAANLELPNGFGSGWSDADTREYVIVSVSDTGTGMSSEVREKVFDPFFTTKEPGKGTGLGLSMVYGFVRQSGGHVAIDSEVGAGTTIKVYLPRYEGPGTASEKPRKRAESGGANGELILVVEDDPDLRTMTALMLKSLGYRTLEADTAKAAVAALEDSAEVNLLLTDMVLPGGMSGRALADWSREKRPELPVLFMSGYTEDDIFGRGRIDDRVQLLEKPFRKEDIARAVRAALESVPA